jgi:uncharacterized protein YoxC
VSEQDPKIVDIRQYTLNRLVDAIGDLGDQVKAMNLRYLRIEDVMQRGFAEAAARSERLATDIRNLHSEVISQANQILDAQQKALRNAIKIDEVENRIPPEPGS